MLIKSRLLLPLTLSAGFLAISYALIASPPQTQRIIPAYVVPQVDVLRPEQGDFAVTIQAQGIVRPAHQQVSLTAQVAGRVLGLHAQFKPGGKIPAGETIIEVDQQDYQLALKKAQAGLISAQALVALERAEQQIAKAEFDLGGRIVLDKNQRALRLREPQLNKVQAVLSIAQVEFDMAKLALSRTAITLPYDVLVLDTSTTVGGTVSIGSVMGNFVRADKVWIELTLPHKHLARIEQRAEQRGAEQRAEQRGADKPGAQAKFIVNGHRYQGELISTRVALTASTRMAGVIVEVIYSPHDEHKPKLLIGTHISANLSAGIVKNSLKIPTKALTDNNQVYVIDTNNTLQLRDAVIQWQLSDHLLIQPSFKPQDRLIVSRISGMVPGTGVKAI